MRRVGDLATSCIGADVANVIRDRPVQKRRLLLDEDDMTPQIGEAKGFHVGTIEPYGAFNYRKIDEGDGTTQLALGTGLLYHFASDRRAPLVKVPPRKMFPD